MKRTRTKWLSLRHRFLFNENLKIKTHVTLSVNLVQIISDDYIKKL